MLQRPTARGELFWCRSSCKVCGRGRSDNNHCLLLSALLAGSPAAGTSLVHRLKSLRSTCILYSCREGTFDPGDRFVWQSSTEIERRIFFSSLCIWGSIHPSVDKLLTLDNLAQGKIPLNTICFLSGRKKQKQNKPKNRTINNGYIESTG